MSRKYVINVINVCSLLLGGLLINMSENELGKILGVGMLLTSSLNLVFNNIIPKNNE